MRMKSLFRCRKWVEVMLRTVPARLLSDEVFVKLEYWSMTGKRLRLNPPFTFNEKINWLKLYDDNPDYALFSDKFAVREYIRKTLPGVELIPLLGAWDRFEQIDFQALPDKFVLKPNHTSGNIFFCGDRARIDHKKLKRLVDGWLERQYYFCHRERPYRVIRPRILAEAHMVDESGTDLKDYKIFCFGGEPKIIQVDANRHSNHRKNFYTPDWEYIPMSYAHPTDPAMRIPKPQALGAMLEYAATLAQGIPFLRADFYCIRERVYFGEMTLYPMAGYGGFDPPEVDARWGQWLNLSGLTD